MDVKVKLEMFEGPLDLLLHLIEKAEIDIYQVPIVQITEQYMQILDEVRPIELETASEFLVMAATLIAIKSRMLLPQAVEEDEETLFYREDEDDPRAELIERLLTYKCYKRLGEVLMDLEMARGKVYVRSPVDLSSYRLQQQNPLQSITADQLLEAFVQLLNNNESSLPMIQVAREEISVQARMKEIEQRLLDGHIFFSQLFELLGTKEQIVTTFLALLELMKANRINCRQSHLFGDILIEWVYKGEQMID